ncbi:hypothetical protein BDV97DRAFT_372236 [Delphinella strobiligena]|nr:hypothetical protein BDV97DRAFT_372236 [Delphinella strobiligena]
MPPSIQPSAIDDSFEYTPTMSWTRPVQQVEYQHYVEPGDTRSAIDDRCKTEYGFVPDRPSFPVAKDTNNLARNLGRSIIESKKAAAVVEPAKSKTVQVEAVKAQSTTPKPSSRPRPVHRYKTIIIRGKDGQTDIRRNPFRIQRDVSKTRPQTPAPDSSKLEDKAIPSVAKSSSSSGKQKVRIVGKDGQEKIMKLSMPLWYDHSPPVPQEKSGKPTASAPEVEKKHATPVKADQTSHTPRQDDPSKRAQRQQPQHHDRPTKAKKNTDVKNEEKVVSNAQSSRTKAATETPRGSQPPVSEVISEVKSKDSGSVRMSGGMPIFNAASKARSSHDSGFFGSTTTSARGSATSNDASKVHSAHDSGVALGSANTSTKNSGTSQGTSKSSRSSSLPTNKTSSMITYPGGGRERASHASEKAAQKAADVCSKVSSKVGSDRRSEASKKSTTTVVDNWGNPPSTSGPVREKTSEASKKSATPVVDSWGNPPSTSGSVREKTSEASKKSTTPAVDSWGNPPSKSESARAPHASTTKSDRASENDWGKSVSNSGPADDRAKSTPHSRSSRVSQLSRKDDTSPVDGWERLDSWLGSTKSSHPSRTEGKAPNASHSGSAKASHSSKKDDISPIPSKSKTIKTSHTSTKSSSTPRDARDQTAQYTIQSYHEWATSLRSSRSSKHQAAFATAPLNPPSIRLESFAGSSRNGGTTYARPGDITPHPLSAVSHDMSHRQPPQVEPAWHSDNRATTWGSQYSHHTGMLSHEPPSSRGSMTSGQSRSNHSSVPSTVPDVDSWDRASQTPTIPFGEAGYVASTHGSGSHMTHRQPTVESVEPIPLPYDESNQHEFCFDGGSSTLPTRSRPRWAGNRPSQVQIPKGYESTDPMKPSPLLYPYPYHYLDPFKSNTEGIRGQMRARE